MYRLHRAMLAYQDARGQADSVISDLSPAAWYRNATGVTSAGGFASQWDDYSGNTRHLVQATGTNQPAYAAGVFTFDGVDNHMAAASWGMVQPENVYIVMSSVTWAVGDRVLDGAANDTMLFYQIGDTPNVSIYAGTQLAPDAAPAVGVRAIWCGVFNGASSVVQYNTTSKTGAAGASNGGGFKLGANWTGANPSNITVEEVVIFSGSAHDSTTRTSVITALNNALTVF